MSTHFLKLLIEKIKLQILILKIQLQIKLFKQKRTVPNLPKPHYTIVHHGGGGWNFWQVNNHHKDLWGFRSSLGYYIGYQKFIEFDGTLHIARKDTEEGAHCIGYNKISSGICLQGNTNIRMPTEAQLKTLKQELDKDKGKVIKGHCELAPRDCPGKYLYNWLIKYRNN